MREAQRGKARGAVALVAQPVARLLGGGAVVAQAVRLDDEPKLWPVEVDFEAAGEGFAPQRWLRWNA